MAKNLVEEIAASGLTIYDGLENHAHLLIDHNLLEKILNESLRGLSLNYPLRTRSKVVKTAVCKALGYPVPPVFRKTNPRFPGQNFDTYVQKANNLQIWNEEISASRRYVLIRIDDKNVVSRVRVITGDLLSALDKTGTLTHKYQAASPIAVVESRLVNAVDTPSVVNQLLSAQQPLWPGCLTIADLFTRCRSILGTLIQNPGADQERSRGGLLHSLVCKSLQMKSWKDSGQFPDVPEQLLEIKLQTARTIDLGLVCPDSSEHLADVATLQHRDVRYAVFYGSPDGSGVRLDHVVVVSGAHFFNFFQRFEGKVRNTKLQIPLPDGFFS